MIMSEESKDTLPTLVARSTDSFILKPDLDRPGKTLTTTDGSSPSNQYFEESTGQLWVGKCSKQSISKPYERERVIDKYYYEYREWLGSALYHVLGIETPFLVLSLQMPKKEDDLVADILEFNQPCMHVMSQFFPGFSPYGETFVTKYLKTVGQQKEIMIMIVLAEVEVIWVM